MIGIDCERSLRRALTSVTIIKKAHVKFAVNVTSRFQCLNNYLLQPQIMSQIKSVNKLKTTAAEYVRILQCLFCIWFFLITF